MISLAGWLSEYPVAASLSRMIDGKPGFLISPKCKVTRKGMNGGYAYKRVQVAGDERFHDKPNKNRFSHPCEGGQYMMLGAGEGESVIPPRFATMSVEYPPRPDIV